MVLCQIILNFYQGGSLFRNLKIRSRWFNLYFSFIKVVLAFIDSLHLLASAATFSLPQVSKRKNTFGLKVFLLWWPPLIEVECKKCLTSWLTYRQFSWAALLLSIIGLTSSPSVFPWLRYFSQGNGQKYPQKIFCTNINWFVIFQTTVTASAHLTVSITLERYFAVVHPLSHFHRR